MASIKNMFRKALNKSAGSVGESRKHDLGTQIVAEPVSGDIDNDGSVEVVIGTNDGQVIAYTEAGEKKWVFKASADVGEVEEMFMEAGSVNSIDSKPFLFDINNDGKHEVLVGTQSGMVYAIDSKGKNIWSYKAGDAVKGSVNALDADNDGKKELVFGSSDGNIYMLDMKGKLKKKINAGAGIESTPVKFGELMIICTSRGDILAYNPEGDREWSYKAGNRITAEPNILRTRSGEEKIVVGSTDNNMYCLNKDGTLNWVFETKGAIYSKAEITDINNDKEEEIIFGSCDNYIYALDEEGKRLWSYETDFWIIGTPVVMDIDDDGKKEVIIGSYDNNIYVLAGEGMYSMEYIPGLSGITAQEGSYSDISTQTPGEVIGKNLWLIRLEDIVIGCCQAGKNILAETKNGSVIWLQHKY